MGTRGLLVCVIAAFSGVISPIFSESFVSSAAHARDRIMVVGSSTVFPFSVAVAERFGLGTSFDTPVVESNGTGGGMKLFCGGVGPEYPDIVNASRRMKRDEFRTCLDQGVSVIEIKIGFDGVVFANIVPEGKFGLTRKQIFTALAKRVPVNGVLVENPYESWRDVDATLPDIEIEVFGPPKTSGTRDAFAELVMEPGARLFPMLEAMAKVSEEDFRLVAHAFREDGRFVETGENDNLVLQKLTANPHAFGIFGFSFLDQNPGHIQGMRIEGVDPDFDHIISGAYPVVRSLYVYIKKEHVGMIPGLMRYVAELTAEDALGDEGYLVDKGLIPLPADERSRYAKRGKEMLPLVESDL